MTAAIIPITNTPRDYAWGAPGGVSRLLGWPETSAREAELWLGAHPASPSRALGGNAGWRDLREWEQSRGESLPFLLKVLCAAEPLSLQAHPTSARAREGFEREERLGISRDDPARNYKDPFAKPEIIVAAEEGFEALCGFREPAQTVAELDQFAEFGVGPELSDLRTRLTGPDPLRSATAWSLSGAPGPRRLAEELTLVASHHPHRFALLSQIAQHHPGDPGLLVALSTNHVVLGVDDALWLPAGNIHAYLRGTGIELMGPSDNVLRGGLTPKHIDIDELQRVVEYTPIPPPRLLPEQIDPNVLSYRPASQPSGSGVGFQLLRITGEAIVTLTGGSIALCVSGEFSLAREEAQATVGRGESVFLEDLSEVSIDGQGRLFVATGTPPTGSVRQR